MCFVQFSKVQKITTIWAPWKYSKKNFAQESVKEIVFLKLPCAIWRIFWPLIQNKKMVKPSGCGWVHVQAKILCNWIIYFWATAIELWIVTVLACIVFLQRSNFKSFGVFFCELYRAFSFNCGTVRVLAWALVAVQDPSLFCLSFICCHHRKQGNMPLSALTGRHRGEDSIIFFACLSEEHIFSKRFWDWEDGHFGYPLVLLQNTPFVFDQNVQVHIHQHWVKTNGVSKTGIFCVLFLLQVPCWK